MVVQIEMPELLQVVNNATSNIVQIIEQWGLFVFYLTMMIFAVWVIWQIFLGVRTALENTP